MAGTDASAVLAGMKFWSEIVEKITIKARQRTLRPEIFLRLATPEGETLLDQFIDLLDAADAQEQNLFPVTINYNLSLESLIDKGGYDWNDENINPRNLRSKRKSKLKIKIQLMSFGSWTMQTDDVVRELKKQNLRPATLPELLGLGSQYPELQTKFDIVALGSIWRSGSRQTVAYLTSKGKQRGLSTKILGPEPWRPEYRFAAARS